MNCDFTNICGSTSPDLGELEVTFPAKCKGPLTWLVLLRILVVLWLLYSGPSEGVVIYMHVAVDVPLKSYMKLTWLVTWSQSAVLVKAVMHPKFHAQLSFFFFFLIPLILQVLQIDPEMPLEKVKKHFRKVSCNLSLFTYCTPLTRPIIGSPLRPEEMHFSQEYTCNHISYHSYVFFLYQKSKFPSKL